MSGLKHVDVVPLIGGMSLAATKVHGRPPEFAITYSPFADNESHLKHHYREVHEWDIPWYELDQGRRPPAGEIDVAQAVCPCAGLSQFSTKFGPENQNNQWMIKTAEYVLGETRPRVFWGENAPTLATSSGAFVRDELMSIAHRNGYSMSMYSTKSSLHGTPQVRKRSFYFFWRDHGAPVLEYFDRPYQPIEDLIRSVKSNFQMEPINEKKPSEDPYYKFILEEIYGGIDHRTFSHEKMEKLGVRTNDVFSFIERAGYTFDRVAVWMEENGFPREVPKCLRKHEKLTSGQNVMRRGTIVPRDIIGAFVGHYPTTLTHPDEDRYVTYREAMTIMGLPDNFELLNPKKSANHICQNVPMKTAIDMSSEVAAVLAGKREISGSRMAFQSNHDRSWRDATVAPSSSLQEFFA